MPRLVARFALAALVCVVIAVSGVTVGLVVASNPTPGALRKAAAITEAPAVIPATSAVTFSPAFAPKHPGGVNHVSDRASRLVFDAKAVAGIRPAGDTTFVSSNDRSFKGNVVDVHAVGGVIDAGSVEVAVSNSMGSCLFAWGRNDFALRIDVVSRGVVAGLTHTH